MNYEFEEEKETEDRSEGSRKNEGKTNMKGLEAKRWAVT